MVLRNKILGNGRDARSKDRIVSSYFFIKIELIKLITDRESSDLDAGSPYRRVFEPGERTETILPTGIIDIISF